MPDEAKNLFHRLMSRSGRPAVAGTGTPNGDPLLLGLLALIPLVGIVACAYSAWHYGFWQPDSWAYLGSPHNEFEYNQRWMLPFFFHILRHMPPFAAWLMAVIVFGCLGYRVARDYLAGSPFESRALSAGLASLFIIMPGLHEQLCWPTHALSASFVLLVMAVLTRWLPRTWLVIIGTPIVYGTHQAFAPLTLLFLIPSYTRQAQQSPADNLRDLVKALLVWTIAFALAWGVAEAILRIAFGHIPVISPFRQPHMAHSLGELGANLFRNFALLGDQLEKTYSVTGVILALSCVLGVVIWRMRATASGGRPWISLLVFSGALFASLYIFTAPIGVTLPFRVTLLFGPATLLLGLALLAAIRCPALVLLSLYAFCFYPTMVSVVNDHWYARYTSGVKDAIAEIGPVDPSKVNGVIILEGASFEKHTAWPEDYSDLFSTFPEIFDFAQMPQHPAPAFYLNGYRKLSWCGAETKLRPDACSRFDAAPPFVRCARLNPEICSAGMTNDGYWLMRL